MPHVIPHLGLSCLLEHFPRFPLWVVWKGLLLSPEVNLDPKAKEAGIVLSQTLLKPEAWGIYVHVCCRKAEQTILWAKSRGSFS